jgi:hypothetical protein
MRAYLPDRGVRALRRRTICLLDRLFVLPQIELGDA